MYELLGALAFATLVAGYVLAVMFVRHEARERLWRAASDPTRGLSDPHGRSSSSSSKRAGGDQVLARPNPR